jgi:Leucine-rich repeat (LRR) protein
MPNATAETLSTIWKLKNLVLLRLGLPKGISDGSIARTLEGIASLQKLQELSLSGKLTDDGLNSLRGIKGLRSLDITGCHGFSDRSLAALVNALPTLKEIKWSLGGPGSPKDQ